ncbi:hypothetical protein HI113_28865 [Corallococcus exiguus]|uniref:hypothetical protein n=1 Tax=Corallococcus TaxID=83461 RepID=UPI000EC2C071|nr:MULTISPECIES: hypothetical protein [Corallococcus]NNB88764.1 hypothetical protein [Corallococcus exiguus]NNB97916.1 hypothetical protein [Corallococcus exiguus]NPC49072.1 hypothetical protein [Corallococcus exiguus]RKH76794.1 hypothetical protein D7X99_33700 [Corallococcus sp. AB032C]
MRPCILALCLLALTGASRAEAEGKPVALIWKGSKDKAEAEAQKNAWGPLEKLLERTGLTPPEGHPRLIESKTLPGLKPGFWVWVLGTCAAGEAPSRLEQLKLLAPGTYGREVDVPEEQLACPQQEGASLTTRDETLKFPSGAALRVFTQDESEVADEEGRGNTVFQTRFHFVLFGKGGEVLDTADTLGDESVDSVSGPSGPVSYRCKLTRVEVSKKKGTLVLTRRCRAGAAECGSVVSADETITVTANDSSVSASEAARENEVRADCGD